MGLGGPALSGGFGCCPDLKYGLRSQFDGDDGYMVLVLFTSPERAKPFVQDHPGYEGGILEQFNAFLEKVGLGYGIALNPGWDVGLDLEPELVRQLAGDGQNRND